MKESSRDNRKKVRMKKIEMRKRGPKMVLEKVRRRELCYLPPISVMVLFFVLVLNFILFLVVSNCVSKKIKRLK